MIITSRRKVFASCFRNPLTTPYTYCISDVIYSLVGSYGYNGRQIGQRVAQEWAVHWASHGGPATRTQRRPAPHAQPVAYGRQRAGRWPLWTRPRMSDAVTSGKVALPVYKTTTSGWPKLSVLKLITHELR